MAVAVQISDADAEGGSHLGFHRQGSHPPFATLVEKQERTQILNLNPTCALQFVAQDFFDPQGTEVQRLTDAACSGCMQSDETSAAVNVQDFSGKVVVLHRKHDRMSGVVGLADTTGG